MAKGRKVPSSKIPLAGISEIKGGSLSVVTSGVRELERLCMILPE